MTISRAPRAIIFDLDGTLVDTVGTRVDSWMAVFPKFGIDPERLSATVYLEDDEGRGHWFACDATRPNPYWPRAHRLLGKVPGVGTGPRGAAKPWAARRREVMLDAVSMFDDELMEAMLEEAVTEDMIHGAIRKGVLRWE